MAGTFNNFQVLYSDGPPTSNIRIGQLLVDLDTAPPVNMLKICTSLSPPVYTSLAGLIAPVGANPTSSVGLAAVNGVALTFMRSDAAPPLSQAIAPTWTATHIFEGTTPVIWIRETDAAANNKNWGFRADAEVGGIVIASDDFATISQLFTANRSAAVLTSIKFGNNTDLPDLLMAGKVSLSGNFSLGTAQTIALAAGTTNDLALTNDTTRNFFRLTPDATGSILTGIVAPSPAFSRLICLSNTSNQSPLFFLSQTGTAANTFFIGSNQVARLYQLPPASDVWLLYDTTLAGWIVVTGGLVPVDDHRIYVPVFSQIRYAKWFNTAWVEEGLPFTEVGTMAAQAQVGGSTHIAAAPRRRATTATALNVSAEVYASVANTGVFQSNSVALSAAGYELVFYLSPQTVKASQRVFYGLTSSSAATPAGADPPTLNMVGFAKNTADVNLQFVRNDGAGARNVTDTGITHESLVGDFCRFKIWAKGGATRVAWEIYNFTDGTILAGSSTNQLPAADTLLYPHFWVDTAATNTDPVALELARVELLPSP